MTGKHPAERRWHDYRNKQEDTVWMKQLGKMSGILCDSSVPPIVKGKMHKMIVQPAMVYGMETVPMTSSHLDKLEVT